MGGIRTRIKEYNKTKEKVPIQIRLNRDQMDIYLICTIGCGYEGCLIAEREKSKFRIGEYNSKVDNLQKMN